MERHHQIARSLWRGGRVTEGLRTLPDEVPVALSYNGTTQAVMMATPGDLYDFAVGFSLTEGIARGAEITGITVEPAGRGIDLQIWLTHAAEGRLAQRRRTMAGPVGCGLCGIESIEEALRPAVLSGDATTVFSPGQIVRAMASLPAGQTLHDATRAAHAAAFVTPDGTIVALREDVGRHNALDKLAGAMICGGISAAGGAVLLTSRVSIDLVQKCAAIGAPVLIAASAPTAQAVEMAQAAGLTLIGLARGDGFEVFSHPQRIADQDTADVA